MKPGAKYRSSVCETQIIIVKPAKSDVELACGGVPMTTDGRDAAAGADPDPGLQGGTELGKRYADEATGLEVVCTNGGSGTLTCDGRPLNLAGAKALPSSD